MDTKKTEVFISGQPENAVQTKEITYYVNQFKKFEASGIPSFKTTWNWAAFFMSYVHLFYRKAYIEAVIVYVLEAVCIALFSVGSIIVSIGCGLGTNFLLYKRMRREEEKVKQAFPNDEPKQLAHLASIGGVNKTLAIIFIVVTVVMAILKVFAATEY